MRTHVLFDQHVHDSLRSCGAPSSVQMLAIKAATIAYSTATHSALLIHSRQNSFALAGSTYTMRSPNISNASLTIIL